MPERSVLPPSLPPRGLSDAEREQLRRECERISAEGWAGVSSYWAAKNILDLISQVDSLTQERDRFAVQIARMVST